MLSDKHVKHMYGPHAIKPKCNKRILHFADELVEHANFVSLVCVCGAHTLSPNYQTRLRLNYISADNPCYNWQKIGCHETKIERCTYMANPHRTQRRLSIHTTAPGMRLCQNWSCLMIFMFKLLYVLQHRTINMICPGTLYFILDGNKTRQQILKELSYSTYP